MEGTVAGGEADCEMCKVQWLLVNRTVKNYFNAMAFFNVTLCNYSGRYIPKYGGYSGGL